MDERSNQMQPMLTQSEAAHFLRASVRTLEDWRVRGFGPKFVKIGSRVCYQQSALTDWVEAQTRTSTAEHTVGKARPVMMAGGR